MYSKAKVAGHPLHPMLVAFPIVFYTTAFVGFVVAAVHPDSFWFRMAWMANAAGVVSALIAAVPGFIDWAFGIPNGTPAKATGLTHMLCHVSALILFTINLFVTRGQFQQPVPQAGAAWLLPLVGLLTTVAGGFLGWKMVQTHHVGVDLTPEQARLEPRPEPTPAKTDRTIRGPILHN